MWFSLDSNQGLMMFCYQSDQVSEEKALKLRKQRGFEREKVKNKQQKKSKRQYDEDDE